MGIQETDPASINSHTMAEVLGVIASGISVGSLAIQILSSIRQILDFWSSVRHAPDDIHHILEELEILAEYLSDQDYHEYEETLDQNRSLPISRALRLCQKAAESVAAALDDLKDGLTASKLRGRWTAVRAALREQRLNKCLSRLERAKSMLFTAQQIYIQANQRYTR